MTKNKPPKDTNQRGGVITLIATTAIAVALFIIRFMLSSIALGRLGELKMVTQAGKLNTGKEKGDSAKGGC